ncbi:DASH complex subunit Dad4 [Dipodascopsis tothii]|uniref:DASH complex subunit Dad4 n=1 Tax=Dipodascopsis tothii TaxID=44089 RepID=UPI0034CF2732
MENPHDQVQNALVARIISSVEKLNEAVVLLNSTLQDLNKQNMDIELLSQLWENYQRRVVINLDNTKAMRPAI